MRMARALLVTAAWSTASASQVHVPARLVTPSVVEFVLILPPRKKTAAPAVTSVGRAASTPTRSAITGIVAAPNELARSGGRASFNRYLLRRLDPQLHHPLHQFYLMHQSTKGLAPVTSRNEALLTERRTGFEPATPSFGKVRLRYDLTFGAVDVGQASPWRGRWGAAAPRLVRQPIRWASRSRAGLRGG